MLYDAKEKEVPLEKEINHLKNIIEVHQLRYDEEDDYTVSFNMSGNIQGKMIAPLIFSPFIENAFKHGIEISKPSFIKINIQAEEKQFLPSMSYKFIKSAKQGKKWQLCGGIMPHPTGASWKTNPL